MKTIVSYSPKKAYKDKKLYKSMKNDLESILFYTQNSTENREVKVFFILVGFLNSAIAILEVSHQTYAAFTLQQ